MPVITHVSKARGALVTGLFGVGVLAFALSNPTTAQEATPEAGMNPAANTWTEYKGNAQRTASTDSPISLPLNLVWQYSSEATPQAFYASPLVAGPEGQRRVYFAVGKNVYCVDAQTGEQVWKSIDLDSSVSAPITMMSGEGGDLILAATGNGRLSAFRTADGQQAWMADAKATFADMAPTLVQTDKGMRIVVGISRGQLLAFTPTGEPDDSFNIQLGRFGSAPTSTPTLSEDGKRLFVPASDSKVYCIDLESREVFYILPFSSRPRSTPLILQGVLVINAGEDLAAFQEKTGAPMWKIRMPHTTSAAPAGEVTDNGSGAVYLGTSRGVLLCYDLQTGDKLWEKDLENDITGTALVTPNAVLVGTSTGLLFGLDSKAGTLQWQYRADTERTTQEQTRQTGREGGYGRNVGGAAYDGGGGGGFGGRGGSSVTVTRSYGFSSLPTAVGEQVFVVGDNAAVFAFDSKPFDAEPPRAVEPALTVTNALGDPEAVLLRTGTPLSLPGTGPIYFAVELDEPGSGIDPASIQATLNGQPITGESLDYQQARGVVLLTLVKRGAQALPDGSYTLALTARDYRGNTMNYTGAFTIDKDARPPSSRRQRGGRGGGGGGGGRGGGGGGRGGRGGDDGDNQGGGGYGGGGYGGGGYGGGRGDDDQGGGGYGGGGYGGGGYGGGGYGGGRNE